MDEANEKAHDAVTVAPHLHRIMFENDKVRVLRVNVKPGEKGAMHWHPGNVSYVLSGSTICFTKPDGNSSDVELAKGQVKYSESGWHTVENVGPQDFEAVQVELKEQ